MDGLMLIDNGEVIAFSMGARMNEQYYDVCFEKAYSAINGAYAMINREFSRMIAEKYPALEYLNREDDMESLVFARRRNPISPHCCWRNTTRRCGRKNNAHKKDDPGRYPGPEGNLGRGVCRRRPAGYRRIF